MTPVSPNDLPDQQKRAFWLRQLHQWHWISSALCLIAMLLFAATGIALNHASQIEAQPRVSQKNGQLPPALLEQLRREQNDEAALPDAVRAWLDRELALRVGTQAAEWSPQEVYVALPRPGGDAWLRVQLDNGELEYELTERGWIAYLNDLHKGRNTGAAWSWFIDLFAVACLVFCISGLLLLKMHAANRAGTWPVVVFGLVFPLLLTILFIH